ncbi:MAG: hypothetical protein U9N83_10810 [Thermodesulfobacteriota bacterium]|nr:hypothetical protein [Thermodesulfobacteriota bacterium]
MGYFFKTRIFCQADFETRSKNGTIKTNKKEKSGEKMKKLLFNRILRSMVVLSLILFLLSSCTMGLRGYTPEQKLEFERFVMDTNTPEKLNTWLTIFEYDIGRMNSLRSDGRTTSARSHEEFISQWTYYPIEFYYRKSGVCNDIANFANYVLRKHGYKSKIFYVNPRSSPGQGSAGHFICILKRDDGKWWNVGDSRHPGIISGPYVSFADIADNLSIWSTMKYWKVSSLRKF